MAHELNWQVLIDPRFQANGVTVSYRLRQQKGYGDNEYAFHFAARATGDRWPEYDATLIALDSEGLAIDSWYAELEQTVEDDVRVIQVSGYPEVLPAQLQLVWPKDG